MATKTINLTGAEVAVTGLDGAHAHIRNDSTDTIYAAKMPGITAGADGVASIPAGQADTIRGISGAVYLLGTGSALIQSDDYVESPFKASTASGGSAVDDVARAAINEHAGNAVIHATAAEKAEWNGKADKSDIPDKLPADGGNADTVGGKSPDVFFSRYPDLLTVDYVSRADMDTDYKGVINSETAEAIGLDGSNSCWWHIIGLKNTNNDGYGTQIAIPLLNTTLNQVPQYRISVQTAFVAWCHLADGGNASELESYHASDFVLKSDYDALAARVAALEGGTS